MTGRCSEEMDLPKEDWLRLHEINLLACLMDDPVQHRAVIETLAPEAFTDDATKDVFESIVAIAERGGRSDLVAVWTHLQEKGREEWRGAIQQVMDHYTLVSHSSLPHFHARILEEWEARTVRSGIGQAIESGKSLEYVSKFVEHARQDFEGKRPVEATQLPCDAADFLETIGQERETMRTNYRNLDRLIGGFEPGEFVVLGGRPGMGKTTFVVNLLWRMGVPVGLLSMEMNRRKIGQLGAMILGGMSMQELMSDTQQWSDNRTSFKEILRHETPQRFFTMYPSALTPSSLSAIARRLRDQHGVRVLAVDNLTLMSDPTHRGKNANRVQELSSITRTMKIVANDLGIVLLGISQLNRQADGRTDPRPVLTDLRDSGSIEQDADVVMFLYREDYQKEKRSDRATELLIRKGRMRNLGVAMLDFDAGSNVYADARP